MHFVIGKFFEIEQYVAKNTFFVDLQTLPKSIRLYGGLNISRITFLLVTPKTAKSGKNFPLKIFKLYGTSYSSTRTKALQKSSTEIILWHLNMLLKESVSTEN